MCVDDEIGRNSDSDSDDRLVLVVLAVVVVRKLFVTIFKSVCVYIS